MERKQSGGRVAAFFDVDGTLVAAPSLERRFFAELKWRRAIPTRNYFLWLKHALKQAPRVFRPGISAIRHANKMYLKDFWVTEAERLARMPVLHAGAIERVAWHVAQGHSIFLVSGTLFPLAQRVALQLVMRLAVYGMNACVGVCATRLETVEGRWTGRILGAAMFGKAKACQVTWLAHEEGFDLQRCYAYGDAASDRWMLEAVGQAAAVNPSRGLERIARRNGWPMLWWNGKAKEVAQNALRRHGRAEAIAEPGDPG